VIGMVHGLAGGAALMLIVLASISSPALGLAYIGIFGAGSILGMGLVSVLMGFFFSYAMPRLYNVSQTLRFATGTLSAAFGTWIVIDIGFVQGLFFN
jgi:hypothetical protein